MTETTPATSIQAGSPGQNDHYTNPVIPGDWSDPGVVRVGDDYYSLRSTFGWQPGLLIAHSKDLVHWRYIGCADTDNAFELPYGITDAGVWGSDIGYNPGQGTFLVYAPVRGKIRVFVSHNPEGPYEDGGDVIDGYDPGFFADDDGSLYLTKTGGDIYRLSNDGQTVVGSPVATVADGEGPELFKRNTYYYYLISPGGTRPYQDHQIMSYRAERLGGPWEPDPANPVMHAPHTTGAKLQGPGHGEVFEAHNGQWFLTYHAYELSHYSLGRQMCMEPVVWTDDGWWRPQNGRIPSEHNPVTLPPVPCEFQASDEFNSDTLGNQWFFHTTPDYNGRSWSLTEAPGRLRIKTQGSDISSPEAASGLFLQRVTLKAFDIMTSVTFHAEAGNEAAGLHLYHDPAKSIWLTTTTDQGRPVIEVGTYDRPFPGDQDPATLTVREIVEQLKTVNPVKRIRRRVENTIGATLYLKMSIRDEHVRFFYGPDGEQWVDMNDSVYFGDSWHCSYLNNDPGAPDLGWVGCGRDNVWTGTVMGIFACRGEAEHTKHADFHWFRVVPVN